MERLIIKKGFFRTAGQKYDWLKKKYDGRGVGVSLPVLKRNREIEIEVEGDVYVLNCGAAIAFIRSYQSIEVHNGTKVGVVSKTLLERISKPENEVIPNVVENPVLQSKLF